MKLSTRNQFPARSPPSSSAESGPRSPSTSAVRPLVAAITRESAEHLELAAGDDVTVLVKATEVMLGK
jgi:ABC-type molybdate transport system ATPase subunit